MLWSVARKTRWFKILWGLQLSNCVICCSDYPTHVATPEISVTPGATKLEKFEAFTAPSRIRRNLLQKFAKPKMCSLSNTSPHFTSDSKDPAHRRHARAHFWRPTQHSSFAVFHGGNRPGLPRWPDENGWGNWQKMGIQVAIWILWYIYICIYIYMCIYICICIYIYTWYWASASEKKIRWNDEDGDPDGDVHGCPQNRGMCLCMDSQKERFPVDGTMRRKTGRLFFSFAKFL